MPDETRRTAPVMCPKCKSPETVRTGAFNVEAQRADHGAESAQQVVIYDRRCQRCGSLFPEATAPPTR